MDILVTTDTLLCLSFPVGLMVILCWMQIREYYDDWKRRGKKHGKD